MRNLVVYTSNKRNIVKHGDVSYLLNNKRFGKYYSANTENTNRLTIVGIPNDEDKTLTIGISFCSYPENFNRRLGKHYAELRATSFNGAYKPYMVIPITEVEFNLKSCLEVLYSLHEFLIQLPIKEVKRLVASQVVK